MPDPIKPHFYVVKLEFTGVYMFMFFTDAVLTNTNNLCFEQKYEKISESLSENFQFLLVKFSIYLNRRIFVMANVNSCSILLFVLYLY